jgi:hypothetical protein
MIKNAMVILNNQPTAQQEKPAQVLAVDMQPPECYSSPYLNQAQMCSDCA